MTKRTALVVRTVVVLAVVITLAVAAVHHVRQRNCGIDKAEAALIHGKRENIVELVFEGQGREIRIVDRPTLDYFTEAFSRATDLSITNIPSKGSLTYSVDVHFEGCSIEMYVYVHLMGEGMDFIIPDKAYGSGVERSISLVSAPESVQALVRDLCMPR